MNPAALFLRDEWVPVLLAAPAAWIALRGLEALRERRVAELAGPRAGSLARDLSPHRRALRRALFSAGLLLALAALLEPAWGAAPARVERRGADVVVCLDVSRSMLARDVPPTRLGRAQAEVRALAEAAGGGRLALVTFAGQARLVVPLTRDAESLAAMAALADPLSGPGAGTDLGAALAAALDALPAEPAGHEAVILLTDGEDHEGRGLRVAEECRRRGVVVHCVGFGTPRGGKIPLPGADGERFLRDREGREVVSAPDPDALRRIAETTGGVYLDAAAVDRPLAALHAERVMPAAARSLEKERRREREPRFQWFLGAALVLLGADLALTDRRRSG